MLLIAGIMASGAAIYNGYPLVHTDTRDYLSGANFGAPQHLLSPADRARAVYAYALDRRGDAVVAGGLSDTAGLASRLRD